MRLTIEAVIDPSGQVRLLQPISIPHARRALVVILEEPVSEIAETALLSEPALAQDWQRPQEDKAWAYLQPATSQFCLSPFPI